MYVYVGPEPPFIATIFVASFTVMVKAIGNPDVAVDVTEKPKVVAESVVLLGALRT